MFGKEWDGEGGWGWGKRKEEKRERSLWVFFKECIGGVVFGFSLPLSTHPSNPPLRWPSHLSLKRRGKKKRGRSPYPSINLSVISKFSAIEYSFFF